MAVTAHGTKLPLYRHASDNPGTDCGRACAQMVISSLVLGSKTNPAASAAVPVTQQQLRSQEPFESDPANLGADGPGGWFTFPDELMALLNSSPMLKKLGRAHWQVVFQNPAGKPGAALAALLDDIAEPLVTQGMPAILNLKTMDHWVVVKTIWLDANLKVDSIEFLDPLGWSNNTPVVHTYRDVCDPGSNIWLPQTPTQLATLNPAIGATPPTTYQGKYLAIVYRFRTPSLATFIKKQIKKGSIPKPKRLKTHSVLQPPGSAAEAVLADLHRIADRLDLADLQALLHAGPQALVWKVKDIDGSDQRYALAAVSDVHGGQRLIAVCNPDTHQVGHFQLRISDPSLDALLNVPQTETLWWSRRTEDRYWQPFFPFQRIDGAVPRYRRLVDNQYLL